jgi:hypothetical protein
VALPANFQRLHTAMSFFDFSADVERAMREARDEASRLSAKTTVHRAQFPSAAWRAGFEFLSKGDKFEPEKHHVVIGAATWSDPDLDALEIVARTAHSQAIRVSVFDIDDLSFDEMLTEFPGIRRFKRTPVVLQYRGGKLTYFGEGPDAVLWLRQL